MAVIKRKDLHAMSDAQRKAKIAELEKAILELRGEGRKDKVKPLKKAIAKLLTPSATGHPAPRVSKTQPTIQSRPRQPAPRAHSAASAHSQTQPLKSAKPK